MAKTIASDRSNGHLGTFGGVFTPCTLTILGVIMFLRFGYIVGEAGVAQALVIVAAGKLITVLTSLSLSAIATNMRVQGGGVYYLISRSLGIEFGGAIGLIFFLAQSTSVAMYVVGFSEALLAEWPSLGLSLTATASIVNSIVFFCVLIGAGWTTRLQYFIFALLMASLLSFYVGASGEFARSTLLVNLSSNYSGGENIFSMFALFFPAVTGVMAGANMSGDLKNPSRSIPVGTLSAVAFTGLIYFSLVVMLAATRPATALVENSLVMAGIARWPALIPAGVYAATLSSALGSMMGAPRILQAFARDNVYLWLRPFAAGSGPAKEPRRATIASAIVAQACILLGDLDAIAPVVTMAFLVTYGLLNLATFYEAITGNPSYRPRFRWCHWTVSLAGAIGCLAVMMLIDWRWALVGLAAVGGLHWQIARREVQTRWGDLQFGLLMQRTRRSLLKLEEELYHPKNWRPLILALSGTGWSRPHLAVYGHWFTAGQGILSLGHVIEGEVDGKVDRRRNQEQLLHKFIRREQLEAFPAVVVAPHLSDGVDALVQAHGLGALRPNTVLFGWPNDRGRKEPFAAMLRSIANLRRSIIAVRFVPEPENPWETSPGTIDVWWRGRQNGDLMLLLAHLLANSDHWRGRTIRLLRVIDSPAGRRAVYDHLVRLIELARIRAVPEVVVSSDAAAAIQWWSRAAAVVFLGFEAPTEGDEAAFVERMEQWAGELSRVVFVDSSGDMSLDD